MLFILQAPLIQINRFRTCKIEMYIHPTLRIRHDIQRWRSRSRDLVTSTSGHGSIPNFLQAPIEHCVSLIQLNSALICIRSVRKLVVARFVERSQVLPDLGDERV